MLLVEMGIFKQLFLGNKSGNIFFKTKNTYLAFHPAFPSWESNSQGQKH